MSELTGKAVPPLVVDDMTPTEREVARISEEVTQRRGIRRQDDLFDLGVTSLAFIRILVRIQDSFGVSINGAELGDDASIAHLATAVDTALKNSNDRS